MTGVTLSDIEQGLHALGVSNRPVVVHSSLSSFGFVDGGADAVITALTTVCKNVMMPAFSWEANAPPPYGDRPPRNGCNYAFYDNWAAPPVRFQVETAGIEKSMGIISRRFLAWPGVSRSDHPWHSWAASGAGREAYLSPHPWGTTNIPLERLSENGGWVILMGVGLTSCTAIHVAEERAGRQPFIRWMRDRHGDVRRVRASGCANGFGNLLPHIYDLFSIVQIGRAEVMAIDLQMLIDKSREVIKNNPEVTRCTSGCIRCADAISGGCGA